VVAEKKTMFKDNLKNIRTSKNMTQGDLARALFVTQQAVSLWETGKGYPDIPTLKSLAHVLGVKVDDLIGVEEYDDAKAEKKSHVAPTWPIVFVFGMVLVALLGTILVLAAFHSEDSNISIISAVLLLLCLAGLLPALYSVYRAGSSRLVLAGLITFGTLFCAFLALSIATITSTSVSNFAPWGWIAATFVSFGGLLVFVILYFRGKRKAAPLDPAKDAASETPKKSQHLNNAWAWVGVGLALTLIVLFLTPWIVAHYAVPAQTSSGEQFFHRYDEYFSMAWLLWERGPFTFLDYLLPLCFLGLLVCSLLALLLKLGPTAAKRLTNASVILMGCSVLFFLLGFFFSFVSMPAA
jgi:transcriptional regulator with XRE-family HTH domain